MTETTNPVINLLIEKHGLSVVLEMIEDFCNEKAAQLMLNHAHKAQRWSEKADIINTACLSIADIDCLP